MKYTTTLLCALLGALSASVFSAQTLTLSLDAAAAELEKFAAEEVRRAAEGKGITLGDDANATRIAITIGKGGNDVGDQLLDWHAR